MSSWNRQHLPVPPWCSEHYSVRHIDKGKMLNARCTAHSAIQILDKSLLWSELWLLKRICYKLNCQLRREKCIGRLKQISKCLKRLREMELNKYLDKLVDMIPSRVPSSIESVYLPSKLVVDYILRCLLGAVAVLSQAINYCTSAFALITQQLSIGVFPKQMTVMAATVSRVWVLCRSLAEKLGECYRSIYIWHVELNSPAAIQVSVIDSLPSDLSEWMSVSNEDTSLPDSTSVIDQKPTRLSVKELENSGEVIDREWFNSRKAETTVSSAVEMRPKSPMIKKVRKFLSPEIVTPPKDERTLPRASCAELHRCLVSVQECSSVSQIYLEIAKLSQLHPGVHFRSMKRCLAQLKKLKPPKKTEKDRQCRIRENNRILRRAKKVVGLFLARNQPEKAVEKAGKNVSLNHVPRAEMKSVKKCKLPKKRKKRHQESA